MDKASSNDSRLIDEATRWFLRQRDGEMTAGDWEIFTDWLEAEPAHNAAFDAVVEADADIEAAAPALGAVQDNDEPIADEPRRRAMWASIAAIAAVFVGMIFLWPSSVDPSFETIATAAGEQRTIAVSDTITLELNGDTRIALAAAETIVRIESGEVAFVIDGPGPSPLQVEVDGLTLVDRGTAFDIVRDERGLRIAVAEGTVAINPDDGGPIVSAGQVLSRPAGSTLLERSPVAPEAVLAWREDRLVYEDTPLPQVMDDLTRNFGVPIEAAGGLRTERFTGVIRTDGPAADRIADAARLFGGEARQSDGGWLIVVP